MTNRTENDRLLDDVLAEAMPGEFRAALLDETLRLARRRRGLRRAQRLSAVCAFILTMGWCVWRFLPGRPTTVAADTNIVISAPSSLLIQSQPMPPSALVSTQPLDAGMLVASAAGVTIVETIPGMGYRIIGDEELLALAGPGRAMLVRVGPGAQELIFEAPVEGRN